eukprot:g12296.t1
MPLDPKATFLTGVVLPGDGTAVDGETLATAGRAKPKVQVKRSKEAPRHVDSRSLVNETIMTMDLPRITYLHKETTKRQSGLDRIEFVMIMATCVAGDISDPVKSIDEIEVETVANFCEIFAQVDINNDGTVDWDELSSFMIEMGMKGCANSGVGMPNYTYAGLIDSARPTHSADQMQYFSENDTVGIMEENANFFRVYHADSMHLKRQFDIKDTWGAARSLCYCSTSGQYALGTSASRVCFYEEGSGTACNSFKAPNTPICMAYSESHDLVAAGDTIGNMFSWKVSDVAAANTDDGETPPHHALGPPFHTKRATTDPENYGPPIMDGGHSDAVLGLLSLPDMGIVASCSMDRTVKLWDLTTLGLQKTLLGHVKGVKHMAYCPDHRLLVSGGFSYDLVINNPYLSSPISRLRGHCSSIVGVEHIVGTSQLITADSDGFCKLWDLRTFSCLETFTSSVAEESRAKNSTKKRNVSTCAPPTRDPVITCMTVSPEVNRVLVGGRTVDSFEVLRDECDDLTDNTAVLTVIFNATNLTFVTASAWAVKVWDGATGELLCADARQQKSRAAVDYVRRKGELFSMCLGTRGRTVVVGDGDGHIQVYNHVNYTELKDYKYPECMGKAHDGNVRALIFVEEHTLLISASGDRSISIHDDSKRDSGTLLRRITNASWSEITVVRYSSHLGLIASGSTDGSIQLWSFEHARHEGCCDEMHQAPVTCLAFLDPFPILLSTDAAGYIALWALPPARVGLRFKRIFTWVNKQPVSDRMYGGGGAGDGEIPVAVTALECQVEMISTSVAVSSTITDPGTISSAGSHGNHDGRTVDVSLDDEEQEKEDNDVDEDYQRNDSEDGDAGGSTRSPPPTNSENAAGEEEGNDGRGGRETGPSTAGGVPATPPERTAGDANDKSNEALAGEAVAGNQDPSGGEGGGGGGGDGAGMLNQTDDASAWDASRASPELSGGGSSRERSFQEHLAATMRKYQGQRNKLPQPTAWSSTGSQEQQRRVHWNTEMLSYTVYAADECGKMTTWDLKAVLIALIHIHSGKEWGGHGVGVVESPAVYSNPFLTTRHDAKDALLEERYRLEAKAWMGWIPDVDNLGLHKIGSWEAHTESIISMNLVDDPPTVLTSAMDRLVKLWSTAGDLRGILREKQQPDTPWKFRVNRQAHEDRKLRSAEDLILAAKMSSRKGSAANTGSQKDGAQGKPPPTGYNSSTEKIEPSNATTTGTTVLNTTAGISTESRLLANQHGHSKVFDNSGRFYDLMAEGGGACGHESLLDVNERPARAPRKYAEEELDRYCESHSSATTKVGPLVFAPSSLFSIDGGDDGRNLPMAPNRRGVLAAILVVVVGLIGGVCADLLEADDKCVTLDYTLSPKGLSALQFDVELGAIITYKSHPSSIRSEILISVSAEGLTNEAIDLNVGETSADGVTTLTFPSLVQFQERSEDDTRGWFDPYMGMLFLPVFACGFLYLHKRGGREGLLISVALLGIRVLAAYPASTSISVSIPDTYCMRLLPSTGTVILKDCSSSSLTGGLPVIDTHTHAWENCYYFSDKDQDRSACPPIPGKKARYTPAGVLPFQQLEEKWYSENITYGVLVQPSFMGVNNSYISDQLAGYPRLRGVIVVTNADGTLNADAAERTLLEEHHKAGVRGIRLNLLKHSEEDMARLNAAMNAETGEEGFKDLWAFIKEHDWHVEAQKEGEAWIDLIHTLVGTGCRVVVDHFSRPNPALNLEDPGWKAVLAAGKENDNVFMKITGTYRLGVGPEILTKKAHLAKENFGIDRLLWGSDYPHTGCTGPDIRHCEDSQNYQALLHTVVDWFPDVEDRQKVLFLNGAKVFSFPLGVD